MKSAVLYFLLFVSASCSSQVGLSARLNGNYAIVPNTLLRIDCGFSPEVGFHLVHNKIVFGANYQYVFWKYDPEYVSALRSNMFEISGGIHRSIRDHAIEFKLLLGGSGNMVKFGKGTEPHVAGFNSDFRWKSLEMGLIADFLHRSGVIGSLGIRAFPGTPGLANYNSLYLIGGLGYRFEI